MLTSHVALASHGRPPSFSAVPPGRLKPARPEDRTAQNQRNDHENKFVATLPAYSPYSPSSSTPFTPFAPRLRGFEKPPTSGTDLPKSVVHEYIRRCIYTSEKKSPTKRVPASRTSKYAHEERKVCTSRAATAAKNAPESSLPSLATAGERQQGGRCQQRAFGSKSIPARMHTPRTSAKEGSGTSLKTPASAPANPPEIDTHDINTLRTCILHNQRKLTELATELKRIATPYAVKESSTQRGEIDGRHAYQRRDQSAVTAKKSRFPSAPAASRRSVDSDTRKSISFHDKTTEATASRGPARQRPQPASTFSQQDNAIVEGQQLEHTFGSRSASTPASFSRLGGAPKSRLSKPAIVPPQTTTKNVTDTTASSKSEHPNRGGLELSRKLVRKEPLSAKEVRKLVFAWKSADQQLKEKMNFWVRDLPTEVRNRVRAASGVEKKFLALRDCVSSLWKASEERALAVLEMHQTMANCKECYQSQQGQVESALVGVQGGLLAASTKIRQIGRLIRLRTDVRSNEGPANCCISSAGGYPFTPYASLYSSFARTRKTEDSDTEKISSGISGCEPAADAGTTEDRGNRKSSCLSMETNEAEIPAAAGAGQTPLCRTRGTNISSAENLGRAVGLVGAHNFATRICLAPDDFSDEAAIPTTPVAPHASEYERVNDTLFGQCPAPGAGADLTAGAPITPAGALASQCRGQNSGAAKTCKAAGAAASAFEYETHRCPPASFCAVSVRQRAPCSAQGDGSLTVKTVGSPHGCNESEVNGEKKMSYHFTVTRTSNKGMSARWNGLEKELEQSGSCAGIEQKSNGGNSVGALVSPPSEGVGLDALVRSSEKRCFTLGQGVSSAEVSPVSFSCLAVSSSSAFPPSAPRGGDRRADVLRFHPREKSTELPAELPTPGGPYQLSNQAEDAYSCASEINDTVNNMHVEAPRDSQGDLSGFQRNQRNCLTERVFERTRLSGAVSGQANLYAFPSQHQRDGTAVKNPPSNTHNEDVSWAADLVSRWRAQRG